MSKNYYTSVETNMLDITQSVKDIQESNQGDNINLLYTSPTFNGSVTTQKDCCRYKYLVLNKKCLDLVSSNPINFWLRQSDLQFIICLLSGCGDLKCGFYFLAKIQGIIITEIKPRKLNVFSYKYVSDVAYKEIKRWLNKELFRIYCIFLCNILRWIRLPNWLPCVVHNQKILVIRIAWVVRTELQMDVLIRKFFKGLSELFKSLAGLA